MTFNNQYWTDLNWFAQSVSPLDLKQRIDTMISKSFMWMWIILLVTFGVAFYVYNLLVSNVLAAGNYWILSLVSIIWWFGLILLISYKWQSFSFSVIAGLLLLFWVLEWIWLSFIFLKYSMASIINVFMLTSWMFFALSVAWYYMKINVSKVWSILFIALIVLILSQIINIFVWSVVFNFWLSILWVIVFSWMIIYDMWVMKELAVVPDERVQLIMAMQVYLSFINLFLFLLRLFGWSKD